MKPKLFLNKCYKSVSGWLVAHNFKETTGDLVVSSLNKEAMLVSAQLKELIATFEYSTPIFNAVDRKFNTGGAMLMKALINKHLYDIEHYTDTENIRTQLPNYFRQVRDNLSSNQNISKIAGKLASGEIKCLPKPDTGKWSRFFYSVPELMFLGYFAPDNLVKFHSDYLYCIARLMLFERKKYTEQDPTNYANLEEDLFKVLCSGFYLYSFNLYSKIYAEIPFSSKGKVPQIKLKMKKDDDCLFIRAVIQRPENFDG